MNSSLNSKVLQFSLKIAVGMHHIEHNMKNRIYSQNFSTIPTPSFLKEGSCGVTKL